MVQQTDGDKVASIAYPNSGPVITNLYFTGGSLKQVWIGNIYEEKNDTNGARKVLFHVYAGGQQVCTFETNSVLNGGSVTTNVGYYYHQDNLGSSSALSDSTGSQKEVNAYYPFGRTLTANPQASFQISRQFTGQVKDDETGLYYYNARYYDPELGRFIQADTIIPDLSNPQSYNRYSYVLNNPLRYIDPDGHGPREWLESSVNFMGGTAIGFLNVMNPVPSQFRSVPRASTTAEAYGRQFGGNVAGTISIIEVLGGVTLAAGGGTVEIATVGAATPVAIPAAAVGVVAAGHGAIGINNWIDTIRNQNSTTGGKTEGIYEFPDAQKPGKTYVGQSGDVPKRLRTHESTGKKSSESGAQVTPVNGGKTQREIAEQNRIKDLGGTQSQPGSQTSNIRNPLSPARQKQLMPQEPTK